MVAWNTNQPPGDGCEHISLDHDIPDIICAAAIKLGMLQACSDVVKVIDLNVMRGTKMQCQLSTGHYLEVDIKLISKDELIQGDDNAPGP